MACQSENASDLALAPPLTSSETQSISKPTLVSSNVLNSQPGILCKGAKNKISKDFTIDFITQVQHCLLKHFDHGLY